MWANVAVGAVPHESDQTTFQQSSRWSPIENEDWFLSTTVPTHITASMNHIYDFVPNNNKSFTFTSMEDNITRPVEGIGKMEVLLRDVDSNSNFAKSTLENVWVIPGSNNQISMDRLMRYGQILFQPNGRVHFEGHCIARSFNGYFKMFISRAPPFSSPPVPRLLTLDTSSSHMNGRSFPSTAPPTTTTPTSTTNNSSNGNSGGSSLTHQQHRWSVNSRSPPLMYSSTTPTKLDSFFEQNPVAYTSAKDPQNSSQFYRHNSATGIIGDKPPSPETTPVNSRRGSLSKQHLSIEEWHNMLGHIEVEVIRDMLRHGLMTTSSENWETETVNCVECVRAKQEVHTERIGDTSGSEVALKSNQPLELIHASLCGPLRKRGVCGVRYFLVIVDDYSRITFALPVNSAGEVGHRLIDFIEQVELVFQRRGIDYRVMGLKITQECRNKRLSDFAKDSDILHLQTVPNKVQMKGVAERMKRTLLEAAIAMRESAGAPACFWDEAIRHAVNIRNRCWNRATNDIPLERFFNAGSANNNTGSSTAITDHPLCMFGCNVELGFEQGIFLGYGGGNTDKIRIYHPDTKKVTVVDKHHIFPQSEKNSFSLLEKYRHTFEEYQSRDRPLPAPLVVRLTVDELMPKG